MMGRRQKLNGDGIDAVTKWRKFLAVFQHPGVRAKTKRRLNRQDRHAARITEAEASLAAEELLYDRAVRDADECEHLIETTGRPCPDCREASGTRRADK